MVHFNVERRRSLRVEPAGEHKLTLDITMPVEVVDISLTGVQLASSAELSVGDRAELRTAIGPRSVTAAIAVRRVAPDQKPTRAGTRYRAGAVFDAVSTEQRMALEQLLGTEPL